MDKKMANDILMDIKRFWREHKRVIIALGIGMAMGIAGMMEAERPVRVNTVTRKVDGVTITYF